MNTTLVPGVVTTMPTSVYAARTVVSKMGWTVIAFALIAVVRLVRIVIAVIHVHQW